MGRLIAISNRTAADPSARAGGLAVAVWESLTSTGGMWFGWSGNIVEWMTIRLPGRIAGSNCPTISATPASSTTQMPT